MKGTVGGVGVGSGFTGLIGGLIGGGGGLLFGDPVLGAMIGAGVGGTGGGAFGAWVGHGLAGMSVEEGKPATLTPESAYDRLTGDEEEPSRNRTVGPLFDRLNERNRLEVHLEEVPRYDASLIDRYDELEGQDLDAWRDTVLDLLFHDMHGLSGVTTHHEADTYAEVLDFLDTAFDEPAAPRTEPSLYTDPDAFTYLLEEMTHDDGVFEDAHILVTNLVNHHDTAEETTEWLEEEYPDLVRTVGQERALKREEEERQEHDAKEDGPSPAF